MSRLSLVATAGLLSSVLSSQPVTLQPQRIGHLNFRNGATRVAAAASDAERLAVAGVGLDGRSNIRIFDEDLKVTSEIQAAYVVRGLGLAGQRVLVARRISGGATVCAYLAGDSNEEGCLSLRELPSAMGQCAGRIIAATSGALVELSFPTGEIRPIAETLEMDESPALDAVGRERVFRLSSTSAKGAAYDCRTGARQPIHLHSSELSRLNENRHHQALLIWRLLPGPRDELWAAPARYSVFQGLPLLRFGSAQMFVGQTVLAIPQEPTLVKQADRPGGKGNPTGHLVVRFVANVGNRVVVADFENLRIVNYELEK